MEGFVASLGNINVIFYILAYLIGGIPFGMILAKQYAKVDVRESGSKSIGATNVLRVVKEKDPALAKKLGIATLALDAIKGVAILAVAAFIFHLDNSVLWGVAVLAVLGHCFSPYLGFEGGKGVATAFGALLFLNPVATALAFVGWFIAAKTLKISSVSSLFGLVTLLVASHSGLWEPFSVGSQSPVWVIAILVFYKHIPNILRLFSGKEAKVV